MNRKGLFIFLVLGLFASTYGADQTKDEHATKDQLSPQIEPKNQDHVPTDSSHNKEMVNDGSAPHKKFYKRPVEKPKISPREDETYRRAKMAIKFKDFKEARSLIMLYLGRLDVPVELRKELLVDLATMYYDSGDVIRAIQIYEKYAAAFPQDNQLPAIYLLLGNFYREIGTFRLAIARYYSVINSSINIGTEEIENYKDISLNAQKSIADTFYELGQYGEALKFFSRLTLLNLHEEEIAEIKYKEINALFHLERHDQVIVDANIFLSNYPSSNFVPEVYYLLSNSFRELGRSQESIKTVLNLLQYTREGESKNDGTWDYWQKRTADQLAEEFYKQGDYFSSLKIYQSMVRLKNTPEWQWPVLYKMGICFEKLKMPPKAITAYDMIISGERWENIDFKLSDSLQYIREMSEWRKENLQWNQTVDRSVYTDSAVFN